MSGEQQAAIAVYIDENGKICRVDDPTGTVTRVTYGAEAYEAPDAGASTRREE